MKYVAVTTAILAVLIIVLGACANEKSERDLESIDAVIASYDAPESTTIDETETVDKILVETTETEIRQNKGVETDGDSTDDIVSVQPDSVGNSDSADGILYWGTAELAEFVLDRGLNGDERKRFLGERYDEVQQYIDEQYYSEPVYYEEADYDYGYSTNVLTPDAGVNYYNGVMETYYNMDMSEWLEFVRSLGYTGEYWVRSDGVKMLGDYIIVASDYSYEPRGTIVQTSLGLGMVLDTGEGGWYWHDIAVAW